MPAITLKSVRGTDGEVTVPSLGLLIASMYKWSLTRREEHGSRSEGAFVLRAAFSYFNPMFERYWRDDSMRKQIALKIGRNGPQYQVRTNGDTKVTLAEHQIILEGVSIWQPEGQQR